MNRSRSRGRLIETAFVSRTCSSTEDLDEVDRLANHPVLRSVPLEDNKTRLRQRLGGLRKSRSESGDGLLDGFSSSKGLSVWPEDATAACVESPRASSSSTSYGQTRKGFRASLAAKLSRSTTLHGTFLGLGSAAGGSPAASIISAPSSWVFRAKSAPSTPPRRGGGPQQDLKPHQQLVRAVVESTPPNTAPLPAKFDRAAAVVSPPRQSNLQRVKAAELLQSFDEITTETDEDEEQRLSSQSMTRSFEGGRPTQLMTNSYEGMIPSGGLGQPPQPNTSQCHNISQHGASVTPPNTAPLPSKFGRCGLSLPQNLLRLQRPKADSIVSTEAEEDDEQRSSSQQPNIAGTYDGVNPTIGSRRATQPMTNSYEGMVPSGGSGQPPQPNTSQCHNISQHGASVTPPNTAPLPSKFSRSGLTLPQNLLRLQRPKADSIVSTEAEEDDMDVPRHPSETAPKTSSSALSPPPKPFRLPLSLKDRLKLNEDSSSAESSPKRAPKVHPPAAPLPVRRGAQATGKSLILPTPASSSSSKPMMESSCSSAVSSLESLRSSLSSGSSSEVSSAARPGLELRGHHHHHHSVLGKPAKFSILSPISDKSQEQYSEQGDHRTPKVSPSVDMNNLNLNNNNNHNLNNNVNNNNNHSQQQQQHVLEDVPWDMPKLRRRLQKQHSGGGDSAAGANLNECLKGSDSGISMASQEVNEMKELLNVPWDMPKLRKKTQQLMNHANNTASNSCSRPNSMPACVNISNNGIPSAPGFLIPPPPAACDPSSRNPSANSSSEVLAPPPPGFGDGLPGDHEEEEEEQFYLKENQEPPNHHQQQQQQQPDVIQMRTGASGDPGLVGRRNRPRMTLSFGVDPALKTLMFATNSPFGLIDCEEVDPNMPLDRQDWYHGAITRCEAENILRSHTEGTYLVRNVDAARQEYAMSLKSAKGFMHMRIRRDPVTRDFQLSDFSRRFMTVPQMVHHYTRNRLPIKGAEHMCLKKPIREQLL